MNTVDEATAAPHGRDDAGTPLAPYGLTLQGHPKKSRRGAQPGQRGNRGSAGRTRPSTPKLSQSSLTDEQRKGMLLELADGLVINPLATVSQVPMVHAKIGRKHADALAGDAFILANFLPGVADGVLLLAKTKPGLLGWMDKVEENAPYVLIAQALLSAGKAIAENHMNPNPDVARAGRNLAAMKMAAMADAVNQQATAIREQAQANAQAAREFAEAS